MTAPIEAFTSPFRVCEVRFRGGVDYIGVGAATEVSPRIARRLRRGGVSRVLVVAGRGSYKASGAWDRVRPALEGEGIDYVVYDRVGPNPTVDMVDEAVKVGREAGVHAVIGIGGGSAIDTAKGVAVLIACPGKTARDLYGGGLVPERALPIVAVNLTHGTGTEVNRFAVATVPEKAYKIGVGHDYMYPTFSVDDPQLTVTLPPEQTLAVTVDALCHAFEAATTRFTSPYSTLLSTEAVRLITKYLPVALQEPGNLVARYYLLYASAIAGISFDNSLLHLVHALEHPLSALKPELPHGLGLGALLPAVVREVYPYTAEAAAHVLRPILGDLKGVPGEADEAARRVERWLFAVGCSRKLSDWGFREDDLPELVRLVYETPGLAELAECAPMPVTRQLVERVYRASLHPLA